jgi:uncharacterized protein DUF6293
MENTPHAQLSGPPLRIEVAPVGYYIDRVVEPIRRHNADRVYLIRARSPEADLAAPFRNRVLEQLRHWKPNLEILSVRTDVWNLESAVETFSSIIHEEVRNGNSVWVNLSTGSKLEAVAAAIACMAQGATPFYVQMESYNRPDVKVPLAEGVHSIDVVPTFNLSPPTPPGLAVLGLLDENRAGLAKKDLLAGLTEAGFIPPESSDRTVQARYARLQVVLQPLTAPPPLATVRGSRRSTRVQITDRGRLALKMFAPRPGVGAKAATPP